MAKVTRGASRSRQQTRATTNANQMGVAVEGRAAVPAPQRRVVRRVSGPGAGEREYAERKFSGQRNTQIDVAESDIREVGEGEDPLDAAQRITAADRPDGGGPLVVESSVVRTAGGGASRAAAPAARPARPAGGNRAQWMGADASKPQDTALDQPVENLVDPEAVQTSELIQRPRQAGPPDPTGNPCTCAYEWETDPKTGDITVFEIDGIATGFRGAPRYMTWCIVCGGERDGNFRPDNAIRYGGALPAMPEAVNAEDIEARVLARMRQQAPTPEVDEQAIVERVMEQVGDTLASDRFIDLLAEKIGNRMKVGAEA